MKISQISRLNPNSPRAFQALQKLIQRSNYLKVAEFRLAATTHIFNPAISTAALQNRAVGGSYTPKNDAPTAQTGVLAIYGDAVDVDRTHIADAERNLGDLNLWLEGQVDDMMYNFSEGIENIIFNGAGTGTTIKGWSKIFDGVTNLPGLGITGVIDAFDGSDVSLDITSDAGLERLIEKIQMAKSSLDGANSICLNSDVHAKLTTYARKKGLLGKVKGYFDDEVETVLGIPLTLLKDGVITNVEPDDDGTPANETTSIYIFAFDEQLINHPTNSGFEFYDLGELEDKESNRVKAEIRVRNEARRKRAGRRIWKIKPY